MFLLKAFLFFYLIITTNCEREKVLLKFKSDVDKVGRDVENLIFDIVRKIVNDISVYQVNGDYFSDEEQSTQHSVTKKTLDGVENTTEEYTTEENTPPSLRIKNLTQYEDISHNRLKRQTSESLSTAQTEEAEPVTPSPTVDSTCSTRFQSGEAVGFRQIEDLKGEIKKLQDLVVLIRNQQKIISLLDRNSQGIQNDTFSRFNARDVLKILNYVNNRDIREGKSTSSTNLDEISNIKNDLKEAITTLNTTKHILAMERKKEVLLEKQLSDQKLDISFLKMMMEKLYKNNMNFPRDNTQNDMLGAIHHLPKELPNRNLAQAVRREGDLKKINDGIAGSEEMWRVGKEHDAGTSDLDDLERIIHKLNQPKNTNVESRTFELQKEMDKQRQEEDLIRQLKFLEKHLECQRKLGSVNSSPSTESEMIRRLQLATKMTGEGKSRDSDDEIELELQRLQEAIDNLRPKYDLDSMDEFPSTYQSDEEDKRFQMMLKKMLDQQSGKEQDERKRFQMMFNRMSYKGRRGEEDPAKKFQIMLDKMSNRNGVNNPDVREHNSLLKEIIELRKELATVKKSQIGNQDSKTSQDGYSYGYPDAYGTKLQIDTSASSFGSSRPYYSSYANPGYQNTWGQVSNSGGSNQFLTEHSSSSDYTKPYNQNFSPRSIPPWYPYQAVFQSPKGPNAGSSPEQNSHQNFYGYNSEADSNSEPLAELHGVPFTISILPGQKALNADSTNLTPRHQQTTNDKNWFQQDRNQFFRTSQQNIHPKLLRESLYHPEVPSGGNTGQPGNNPSEATENVGSVYQKAEDLMKQIYRLQHVIDDLNRSNYTQTQEGRENITILNKQINHLIDAIRSPLNPETSPQRVSTRANVDQNQDNPAPKSRRRSVESNDMEANGDSRLYDNIISRLKQLLFEKENKVEAKNPYDDLQRRIDHLRDQLESRTNSKQHRFNTNLLSNSYQPSYYQHNHMSYPPPKVPTFAVYQPKKNDAFTSIILKILDKITDATPAIVERLFGRGLWELSNFGSRGENYNSNVGNSNRNDLQKLLKNLGLFGYGPLIFLNVIDGLTTFMKILRRNEFFKNFLTPAAILLLVAGAIVFLVWWLRSDADLAGPNRNYAGSRSDKYDGVYSNYNYHGGGYGNNNDNYGYGGSYVVPVNSGGYFRWR